MAEKKMVPTRLEAQLNRVQSSHDGEYFVLRVSDDLGNVVLAEMRLDNDAFANLVSGRSAYGHGECLESDKTGKTLSRVSFNLPRQPVYDFIGKTANLTRENLESVLEHLWGRVGSGKVNAGEIRDRLADGWEVTDLREGHGVAAVWFKVELSRWEEREPGSKLPPVSN